jgi:hypothetical protein
MKAELSSLLARADEAIEAILAYWHFSDQSDEADDVGSLRESGPRD